MKNNNILWIIGVIIVFLVLSPQIDFEKMFGIQIIEFSPDSENLKYQVHEGIKLIEDGCIIEQRNSGTYSSYLSCNTWLYREQEDGYIDFNVKGTPFLWYKDGVEWRWIYEMNPVSGCQLKYYKNGLWTYLTAVKLDGGKLIREISDLYTYTNSDLGLPIKESYISYISPDWIMSGTCPLGTYTYEESIVEIDDCGSFGVVDPFPSNGIDELKCNAYCIPGLSECVVRTLDGLNESQNCLTDGSEIKHEVCYGNCEDGACTQQLIIEIPSMKDYHYGEDVNVTIRLLLGGQPYTSNLVTGRLEMGGASISETFDYTDGNGYTTLNFENVKAGGYVSLVVSTIIRGIETQETAETFFSGVPVFFQLTTESYSQPNAENITFLVEVIDSKYKPISPEQITDLRADTNLSDGDILKNYIEYMGSGIYEVKSDVTGTGIFSGRLLFTYQGELFESPSINIDVEYATISVGTDLITPIAILDTEETFTITFASTLGELIDPDNITIIISFPTGYEEDILTMKDLRRTAVGIYEFDYYFSQVEKHSFDIYADKEGFVRGNAKATVSVTEEGGWLGPGPGFGFGNLEYVLYAAIALIIIFFIIGRRKKGI